VSPFRNVRFHATTHRQDRPSLLPPTPFLLSPVTRNSNATTIFLIDRMQRGREEQEGGGRRGRRVRIACRERPRKARRSSRRYRFPPRASQMHRPSRFARHRAQAASYEFTLTSSRSGAKIATAGQMAEDYDHEVRKAASRGCWRKIRANERCEKMPGIKVERRNDAVITSQCYNFCFVRAELRVTLIVNDK